MIDLLESGETDTDVIQEKLDEAVCAINDLQDEFDENDSEIETVARDCIGENVGYITTIFLRCLIISFGVIGIVMYLLSLSCIHKFGPKLI